MGIFDPPTPEKREQLDREREIRDIERRVSVLEDCAEWEAFLEGYRAEGDALNAYAIVVRKQAALLLLIKEKHPRALLLHYLYTPEGQREAWCQEQLGKIRKEIEERYQCLNTQG